MAIDTSAYPKTTNYDLITYNGNTYANFVETLTPNFNKIDDQMKKNEDAASSKNQQIDEISTTVEQINQELPQIRENAEHAASDASAALASATAASNLAQTANTAANLANSAVGTVATELAELTSTVNTNTQNIKTNARNIQGFEDSINTVNENYTDVNGKLTTTIANVKKLKTGFDNVLSTKDTSKTANVVISVDTTLFGYKIRVNASSVNSDSIFFLSLKSSNKANPNPAKSIPIFSISEENFGIGTISILAGGDVYISAICYNNAEFFINSNEVSDIGINFNKLIFETSNIILFGLPSVPITNPS